MRCNYCEWRCELKEGNTGVCGAYIMKNGAIKEKLPHHWSSLNVVHIESLPFYHAYPGSRSLSIGSSGCNFDCSYCSNSYIARVSPSELFLYHLGPKEIIKRVKQTGCHNIDFALNEPMVSLQSLQELGEEADGIWLGEFIKSNTFNDDQRNILSCQTIFNESANICDRIHTTK
jgi:pyruvate formate lyase activating enzyme